MDLINKATSAVSSIGSVGSSSSSSSSSSGNGSSSMGINLGYWTIQRISLVAMFIALILTLFGIAFLLYKSTNSNAWPPYYSDCPDHWVMDENKVCVDVHNLTAKLSNGTSNRKDFNDALYKGENGLCQKQIWAKGQQYVNSSTTGIAWDGIDVNSNPDLCSGKK